MDIDEFEKQMQPTAKRSKLEPFQEQIFELKGKNYANWQVRKWLAANGVTISVEGVRKFIKSREGSAPPSMPGANTAPAIAAPKVSPVSPDVPEAGEASPADELAGLDSKQRRERVADKYIKTEAANPLLDKLNKGLPK